MGRPNKPAQLKVLEGNFRPDRDSQGVGESRPVGVPDCPVWLPKKAKKYWKDIGPKLAAAGLLSVLDQATFAAHCDSVGKFEEVTRLLKTIDDAMDKTPNGLQIQSAMFTIRNKLWDQVMSSGGKFGLSAADATKIKAPSQQQLQLDGWEDI